MGTGKGYECCISNRDKAYYCGKDRREGRIHYRSENTAAVNPLLSQSLLMKLQNSLGHLILIKFHAHMRGTLNAVILHRHMVLRKYPIKLIASGNINQRIARPVGQEKGYRIFINIILALPFLPPFPVLLQDRSPEAGLCGNILPYRAAGYRPWSVFPVP